MIHSGKVTLDQLQTFEMQAIAAQILKEALSGGYFHTIEEVIELNILTTEQLQSSALQTVAREKLMKDFSERWYGQISGVSGLIGLSIFTLDTISGGTNGC
jgi:hypothetical protein